MGLKVSDFSCANNIKFDVVTRLERKFSAKNPFFDDEKWISTLFCQFLRFFAMPIREKTKRICCAIFGWEELVAFSVCIFATHLSIKIEGVCSILFVCFLGVLTSSNSFAAQRQLKGKCANGQRKQMNKKCFSFNGHWHGFSEGHFTFLTRPIGFYFLFVFGG